jgi:F-type H+-transporting ATPase subunit b
MQLVDPGIGIIFWTSLAFLVVWTLLGRFAFKPMLKAIKDREEGIDSALKNAEKARLDVENLQRELEDMRHRARVEREQILNDARKEASRVISEAQETAKKESNRIIESAQEVIINEKKAALAEVRNQVAIFSLEIAEKVLRNQLEDKNTQARLVNTYINELKMN